MNGFTTLKTKEDSMDMVDKKIGNADLKVTAENKQLTIKVDYPGHPVGGGAYVNVDAHELLQKIADLIPGNSALEGIAISFIEKQLP